MKKSFLKRFQRKRAKGQATEKTVATFDDIRKKLETYERKEGPANFGAAMYHVNEDASETETSKTD